MLIWDDLSWREDPDDAPGFGWRGPVGYRSLLDVRSLADKRAQGGTPRRAFFSIDPALAPSGSLVVGSTLTDSITSTVRSEFRAPIGIRSVADLLRWIMTRRADPAQETATAPVVPVRGGDSNGLRLGVAIAGFGRISWRKTIPQSPDDPDPDWQPIREALRRQLQAIANPTARRKVLYHTLERRLGVRPTRENALRVLGLDEHPHRGSTSIEDNFNRSDRDLGGDTSSDGQFTWSKIQGDWDIVSNVCQSASNDALLIAAFDLDADTDAEIDMPDAQHLGPITRYATGPDCYWHKCRNAGPSNGAVRFKRLDNGPETILVDQSDNVNDGDNNRLNSNGSDHEGFLNDVSIWTHTDSTYTANTRTGIGHETTTPGDADNFLADDGVVAGGGARLLPLLGVGA